jgi:hypothetical protein
LLNDGSLASSGVSSASPVIDVLKVKEMTSTASVKTALHMALLLDVIGGLTNRRSNWNWLFVEPVVLASSARSGTLARFSPSGAKISCARKSR